MNSEAINLPMEIGTTKKPLNRAKAIFIIGGSIFWSLLFFRQYLGLNVFLFALLTLIGLFILQKEMFLKKGNMIFIIGLFISAFFVLYYGSVFPIIMFILTIIFISTIHYPEKISILTRPFISAVSALNFWLVSWVQKLDITSETIKEELKERENPTQFLKYILLIAFSLLTIVLFFFLYRESNEVFKNITNAFEINLSPELIGFTLIGIVVLNMIFNTSYFQNWSNYEMNIPEYAQPTDSSESTYLKNRNFILIGLLVLLNLLILMINCIDIFYLFGWISLPTNVSHSDIVHQAIGSVIFSIIVAMILILVIYKKSQSPEKITKWLLVFAFVWVAQNVVLVFTTMEKNYQYIAMNDLTYKRIGVMVYLLLTLIGLFIVTIKLRQKKSNWFVFRQSANFFYMILLILSVFNWPVIVTTYNLNSAKEKGYIEDKEYLLNLDSRNLVLLSDFANENPEYFTENEKIELKVKLDALRNNVYSWQSFTISNHLLKSQLE